MGHTCIKIIRIRYIFNIEKLTFCWSSYIVSKIDERVILYSVITKNLRLIFSDIDECISKPCDTNATCENFVGSHNCTCKKGFSGDGSTCTGDLINDCTLSHEEFSQITFYS